MPIASQLNLDETFEDQKDLVNNTIVPTVMEALDKETFPITETIVYEIIHNRHKHQREEHLKKKQSEKVQDEQNRRKHSNSRRNDVRNRPFTISSFFLLLIALFYYILKL